ncbi:MAG: hypothetical protein ACJ735_08100 [Actinomycetes bacterium]
MDAISLIGTNALTLSATTGPESLLSLEVAGWTDIRAAVLDLEAAVAAPAQGPGWVSGVGAGLQRLAQDLAAHAATEDGPGGLYRRVLADAPRLAGEVRRLRAEIDEISSLVTWLLAVVAAGPIAQGVDWRLDVREDVNVILGRLLRHRQSDADLIYEAYTVDVGDAADA